MTGKKSAGRRGAGLAAGLLLGALLILPIPAGAELVELPGLAYNVNGSMADNLKELVGKKVYVALASGVTFTGSVKAVGREMLHLEKLQDKEYFDALIRLDTIVAIDTRFRDFQR